ncbi:MAG: 2-oxo acid dehydrogenase subunit E2 [Deltaproteobacteria bacterium]|nr:2-oxo acid dehydrogenase subunit E2 [Deltaproteobacteria bacterium]
MPVDIVMPKLGLTMTEGLIVEWKKKEGDEVQKGEILFVLETEKVTYEVEAPEDGVLGRIVVQDQETVPVGAIVAYLLKPGESAADLTDAPAAAPAAEETSIEIKAEAPATATPVDKRIRATPLARKIAGEYGMDISTITGTGPSGRVVREDVEKAKEAIALTPPETPSEEKLVKFTGMRRAIAKNMLTSKTEAALAYMGNSVDATKIQELRETLLPYVEKKHGVRVTITDIMMKITGAAICEHPVINTRWTDEGILFLEDVHMGMAMALDNGLIVPVIRNINKKGIGRIAMDRVELIAKGRESRYTPDDIKGGTFTLSAMGMFGLENFSAIVNQPESAILAVAAIMDKPVALNGEVVIRPMMNFTLTYDHRTIDGAEAGKFCRTLKEMIENPMLALAQ